MTVVLSPIGGAGWQFFTNTGAVLSGGKLYIYNAGTTTPATTYTSSSGATPNTNPIILDSAGRIANQIWLPASGTFKFVLKTSTDITLWTKDDISGSPSSLANLVDGTAAAPAIAFAADPNTGIYRAGADTLNITTGGTDRLSVDAAGVLTIGYAGSGPALSTTVSAKFQSLGGAYTDIATAASGTVTHGPLNSLQSAAIASTNATVTYTNASTLYVAGAPTAGTNVTITNPYAVYVVSGNNYLGNGRTGIGGGSLTPVTKLHVSTNVDDDGITVESTNDGSAPGPVMSIYRNSGSPANADSIGFIRFQGNNSGATLKEYGSIRAQINTVTAGAETSTLVFQVLKATAIIQPMAIGGANGLVTIGTGLSITNVAVTAPAASDGNVYGGSYTPTNIAGANANVSAVTFTVARYLRVGNAVTVAGAITLTPTTGGVDTAFYMSVPTGGTFSSTTQANGNGVAYSSGDRNVIAMRADTSGARILVKGFPSTNSAVSYSYTFTYEVQ